MIQLFMNGGVSQMDTFDYKPELERRHGKPFDPGSHVEAPTSTPGNLMKSPFPFRQHGECGRWVSSVFPNLATCVDDMAFLMAISSKTNVHGPASYMMNTGFLMPGFPCLGSWLSYGLGSLGDNLPTFVVLPDPRGLPYNAKGNFTAGFLPMSHQGTIIQAAAPRPVPDLFPPASAGYITPASQREGLEQLARLNRRHAALNEGDTRLESRIAAYELAARMQQSAPEALDLASETAATRALYGLDDPVTADFGRRCLLARRLVERGVRFVQVWSGANGAKNNWDNHTDIPGELPAIARTVDRPAAACSATSRREGCSRTPWSSGAPSSAGCRSPRAPPAATTTAAPPWPGSPARGSREERATAKAIPGAGRQPKARPTATTSTPPSSTSWASTTAA